MKFYVLNEMKFYVLNEMKLCFFFFQINRDLIPGSIDRINETRMKLCFECKWTWIRYSIVIKSLAALTRT
jgi:hypothetical protein